MKSVFVKQLLTIAKNKKVAIMGHRSSDFDCICSCIAMHMILKQFNISSDIFVEEDLSSVFKKFLGNIKFLTKNKEKYDVRICVDCSSTSLIPENLAPIYAEAKDTFAIDHHVTNNKFAKYNYVKTLSSACEVIYDLFGTKIKMTKEIARALYLGIYTDTGGFKYSNTTSKTFFVLSKLLKIDIKADEIVHDYVDKVEKTSFELTRCAFNSVQFYYNNQIAVSIITKQDFDKIGVKKDSAKFMQSYLQNIEGVKIAITVSEQTPKEYHISLRTACDDVDVSSIATRFGGGGHVRASGLSLKGEYKKALNALLMECKKVLKGKNN